MALKCSCGAMVVVEEGYDTVFRCKGCSKVGGVFDFQVVG